ncbi:MAG: DNA topoisomerase IB [Pseudomonadota bacterium]
MNKSLSPALVETVDQHLSIVRLRRGKGFSYLNDGRTKISTSTVLQRIRLLAIPPMWEEVLISVRHDCHIQAVGRDQKGRKQYIYHAHWHLEQQRKKFARLVAFAQQLPLIRKECIALIRKKTWSKDKALALMVLVLDDTGIRIGNRQYLQSNETYGLSTLQDRHLDVHGRTATLHFRGKSGKDLQVDIDDPRLTSLVRQSADLPGYSLFRYQEADGSWHDVCSDDVNAFIRARMGEEFSCKDFRTWVGTRLVLELYPQALRESEENPRKKLLNLLVSAIAAKLGNTVAVCRSYYIHPALLTLAEEQKLPVLSERVLAAHRGKALSTGLSGVEKATLQILRKMSTD